MPGLLLSTWLWIAFEPRNFWLVGGMGVAVGVGTGVAVGLGLGVGVGVGVPLAIGVGVGSGPFAISTYADAGPEFQVCPFDHVDGSPERFVADDTGAPLPVPFVSRYSMVPVVPVGWRMASQYRVPAVTDVPGTANVFHAPPRGDEMLPLVSNAPGLPPASEYRPT